MRSKSDATQLREAKRQLNQALRALDKAKEERDIYRVRATKAEQEVVEWEARFDVLLRRGDAVQIMRIQDQG